MNKMSVQRPPLPSTAFQRLPKRDEAVQVAGLTLKTWKTIGVVGSLVFALALPWFLSNYQTFQITTVLCYAIMLLGLNILTGFNGQFSLGHGAFFAVGAYTAAILIHHYGFDAFPYAALPIAALSSFLIGWLFGIPATRLSGHYLALATFALAVATPQILKFHPLEHWTGGVQGILILKPDPPKALATFTKESLGFRFSADMWMYYISLAVTMLAFVTGWFLLRGRIGRAIVAIRDHQMAASTMGVDVASMKALTFGVSAMYTGLGGALLTLSVGFVGPDSFQFVVSVNLLIGMVVGGIASIYGAFWGALFLIYMPNYAADFSIELAWAIFGAVLIGLMYVMPTGAAGFLRLIGDQIVRRLGRPVAARADADGRVAQQEQAPVGGPARAT